MNIIPILSDQDLLNEIWVGVPGYSDLYEISNMGRVKRLQGFRAKKERISFGNKCGRYIMYTFCKDGIHDRKSVHRMVARLFHPNPLSKPEVNHIDANSYNNRASNLEWSTQSENIRHAHKIGNMGGTKNANSKFTEEDVLVMRLKYCYGYGLYHLSKMYKKDRNVIEKIITGKSYSNVIGAISELRYEPKYSRHNAPAI